MGRYLISLCLQPRHQYLGRMLVQLLSQALKLAVAIMVTDVFGLEVINTTLQIVRRVALLILQEMDSLMRSLHLKAPPVAG